MGKREKNEIKYENWIQTDDGGRIYIYEVTGKSGWKAKYIKTVDENENTLFFVQEIYDENGDLVEIHEKFPVDKGHRKVK
ncbi:MAG: hypothetical protein K8I03_03990 [Ignavibacteria bacterium]|nr:hypothetical protein [Ignavibacteria bacterium]